MKTGSMWASAQDMPVRENAESGGSALATYGPGLHRSVLLLKPLFPSRRVLANSLNLQIADT
jgi:hypothetical protein